MGIEALFRHGVKKDSDNTKITIWNLEARIYEIKGA